MFDFRILSNWLQITFDTTLIKCIAEIAAPPQSLKSEPLCFLPRNYYIFLHMVFCSINFRAFQRNSFFEQHLHRSLSHSLCIFYKHHFFSPIVNLLFILLVILFVSSVFYYLSLLYRWKISNHQMFIVLFPGEDLCVYHEK